MMLFVTTTIFLLSLYCSLLLLVQKNMMQKFNCHLPENAVDMSVSAGGVVGKVGHLLQHRVLFLLGEKV